VLAIVVVDIDKSDLRQEPSVPSWSCV
jgi:hypothetical protein